MRNLTEHARYEMTRAGLFDNDADYRGAHAHAVMELIETFAKQGHSGMSSAITLRLFHDLAQFKPLGPITSDPGEWMGVSEGLWQNQRRSTSFSRDGGATWYDIEDESLNNGDVWQLQEMESITTYQSWELKDAYTGTMRENAALKAEVAALREQVARMVDGVPTEYWPAALREQVARVEREVIERLIGAGRLYPSDPVIAEWRRTKGREDDDVQGG